MGWYWRRTCSVSAIRPFTSQLTTDSLDLLTALWLNKDPLITPVEDIEYEKGRPKTSLQTKMHRAFAAREAFKQISSTLTLEQTHSGDEERSPTTTGVFDLLKICTDCLDTFWEGSDTDVGDLFFERLNMFSSEHCGSKSGSETQSHHLARVFHQTMAIIYNVMINRHPFAHQTNQSYVDGVVRTVSSIDERTWKAIPYLRYLALLTGASAARDASDKSFFHTHLGKCQMVLGISRWPEAKRFIVDFLRFQRGIEPRAIKIEKRMKYKQRLEAAGGQDAIQEEYRADFIPVDNLLNYTSLSWRGENANMGLEELLTNDRTFHEAMLNGAFWKTE